MAVTGEAADPGSGARDLVLEGEGRHTRVAAGVATQGDAAGASRVRGGSQVSGGLDLPGRPWLAALEGHCWW